MSESNANTGLTSAIGRYVKLLVEDTRLNIAEKLTRLLSAVAVCAILLILALVALVFISIGVSLALAPVLDPVWAFLIVAAFYLVLIGVLLLFKTQLIVDPIARFLSSLLLDPPATPKAQSNDKSASLSKD
ncbi:MAG: phage holin family protein [Muribaculaceae bacterium]|nr:phage holin family protein [Muribaculaceae bacterium]